MKDFDSWNDYKKSLNETPFVQRFSEREIWWCSIGVNIGCEQEKIKNSTALF